jgi:hypothetical protein
MQHVAVVGGRERSLLTNLALETSSSAEERFCLWCFPLFHWARYLQKSTSSDNTQPALIEG